MMNPFSIRRAQASFLRVAINAENVAQYILSRGSRPLLVPASAARRLQLESADASTTHRRRHHTRRSHEKPSIQLAFNPSFRLDALANFSSALGASSRQRQSPLIRALGARHASTDAEVATSPEDEPIVPSTQSLTNGLTDEPMILDEGEKQVDWAHSFHGLSREPFAKEAAETLMKPLPFHDVEIKPDGIIYLPEIKYRRILNQAFGPGGWGLAPRGETIVTGKAVTREYALVAHGRLVSVARGEQDYFSADGIATATEGCKSNAMMRCCKDLGVASELWDPRFIRKFMSSHAKEVWVEHVVSKKKKKIWIRKDDEVRYPYKESKYGG